MYDNISGLTVLGQSCSFSSLIFCFGYMMVCGPLITELDKTEAQQHKTCNRSDNVYLRLFVIFSCDPVLNAIAN